MNKEKIEDMDKEYLMAYVQYVEMTQPNIDMNSSKCVKAIYQGDYWKAKELLGRKSTEHRMNWRIIGAIGLLLAIVSASILIICKRKKKASDEELLKEEEKIH